MRWLLISLLWLACGKIEAADSWSPGPGWKLVWAEEFSGNSINRTNWVYDVGRNGWGNRELQTYTTNAANAQVTNGTLVITALKQGTNYTSARLKTQGLHSWRYGKIAARLKLPYGQGIWPAFWTLGTNISSVGWPRCGEIDIMEMIGGGEDRDDTTYGTLHWHDNRHVSRSSGPRELPDPKLFHENFHVFEIEWGPKEIIWKLDGSEHFRTSIDTNRWPAMTEFHQPHFILLNLAVGGKWPGYPNDSTVFPQRLQVDWVRVYQEAVIPATGS